MLRIHFKFGTLVTCDKEVSYISFFFKFQNFWQITGDTTVSDILSLGRKELNQQQSLFHQIFKSKQNGAAVDVSAEIVSYSYFYWKKYDCNWVTKLRSRYYCTMSRIRPRLIRCHWSFDPRWVKISGHSEQLGPCGSTSHFVNNRHSKVKTRGASCIGGFGQTEGRRKFERGIPQSRCASYIRGASYIRDKTVHHHYCVISFITLNVRGPSYLGLTNALAPYVARTSTPMLLTM